jgi:DNA-directed RNA polymerase subunit RPC12/RpoP
VGYCKYIDEKGRPVEIYCTPYKPLEVFIAGQPARVTAEHIMVWTRVAGLLGSDELYDQLKRNEYYRCRKCGRYTEHVFVEMNGKNRVYQCRECGTLKTIYSGLKDAPERSMGWR